MSTSSRIGRIASGVALAWLFAAIFLAAMFWPSMPRSWVGWLAFVAFGPLLYFMAEAASQLAWSSRAGRAISNHSSSAVRIIAGVLVALIVGTISFGVSWFIVSH